MERRLLRLLLFIALACASALACAAPIELKQATQLGESRYEPGDTAKGGNGQTVDGIPALSSEMLNVHYHAHLALFYKGRQIAVPYGIGIVKPFTVEHGFVGAAPEIYWIHTHDATGIIHIESPDKRVYTLGNFFDIWGQPLERGDVAGLRGAVRAFVDGKPYRGDLRAIPLEPHGEITLEVGKPFVPPPVYAFPQGL